MSLLGLIPRAAMLLLVARSGEARPVPVALTPDQQIVVAEVVNDTFPLRRRDMGALVLCLDVQLSEVPVDAEPPPEPRRRPGLGHARTPAPKLPGIRGAPQELVERLVRPWRTVVSALSCRLDPKQPYTLDDAKRTPARLVTVRLGAQVASGALTIDWTAGGYGEAARSSRDCRATRGPRGWDVRCGGTWEP